MSVRESLMIRALPVALAAAVGCGQANLKDQFNTIVDPASFNENHAPSEDANADGVLETLPPREGYVDGRVVQFFDMGEIPLELDEDDAPITLADGSFVTRPNYLVRFTGTCDAPRGREPLAGLDFGFDYDPRGIFGDFFSPFTQHDIIEFLPDGESRYNPVMEIVEVAIPSGFECNEVQNIATLRLRLPSEDFNNNGVLDINDGEDIDNDAKLDEDLGGDLDFPVPTGEFLLVEVFHVETRLPDLIASPVLDPTNVEGVNLNFVFFDPDGPEGLLGGIPAYLDEFRTFFKSGLLHRVEFRPPTVVDAGDLDGDGNNDGLRGVATMRAFFDAADADARPIFEFAPGEAGFQPLIEVVNFTRPAGFLPSEIDNVEQLQDLVDDGLVTLTETGTVRHAAFVIAGVDDPTQTGTSVFFADSDNDGVTDFTEDDFGSNPDSADSDGDGLEDGEEDRNRDGRIDSFESDPTKADSDNDGIEDPQELLLGTDPTNADTDGDGLDDGEEDLNANGIVDNGETSPLDADSDNDGLSDGVEDGLGTDPLDENSDNDCLTDGEEQAIGSDPLDVNSPVNGGGACN